jgi:hypothetical protein
MCTSEPDHPNPQTSISDNSTINTKHAQATKDKVQTTLTIKPNRIAQGTKVQNQLIQRITATRYNRGPTRPSNKKEITRSDTRLCSVWAVREEAATKRNKKGRLGRSVSDKGSSVLGGRGKTPEARAMANNTDEEGLRACQSSDERFDDQRKLGEGCCFRGW